MAVFWGDPRTIRGRYKRAVERARPAFMPAATRELDDGMEAIVYETEDPDVVVRVAGLQPNASAGDGLKWSRELDLLDPDYEGGVVRVLHHEELEDRDGARWLVTWKERVDPWVEGFLLRSLPKERAREVAGALLRFWEITPRTLLVLDSWEGTRGLAEAIEAGLPTDDLDLHSNLGVTRDGRVVAYDL